MRASPPRSISRSAFWITIFLFLTALTQVGGILLWLSFTLARAVSSGARPLPARLVVPVALATFVCIYAVSTAFVLPALAPIFGRVPLGCRTTESQPYKPASMLYCALNRHYARPGAHAVLESLSRHMAARHPGTITVYLDAGFPFFDGFPLLPHLSHDDGRKLDLAFFYLEGPEWKPRAPGGAWLLGYWAFAQPGASEPQPCAGRNDLMTMRWNLDWLQPRFAALSVDEVRTGAMLRYLSHHSAAASVEKILLEPHLKTRLGLDSQKVRFAGCRAARHDDHLHFKSDRAVLAYSASIGTPGRSFELRIASAVLT